MGKKGGTARRYAVLRMETVQNQSSMPHQITLPKIQAHMKKISVMNSTIVTQLHILVFHPHRATASTSEEFTAVPLVK